MALFEDNNSSAHDGGGVVVAPFLAAVAALDREKEKLQASIVSTLAGCVPGWADVEADDVTVDHVGGAMTNLIFIVTTPSGNHPGVLVRIYGEGTESFFSRTEETRLFELLSQQKIGVQLLGQFPNGRAEKIIDGTTLTAKQMRAPEVSRRIARKMREFHELEIDIDHEPTHMSAIRKLLAVARVKCTDNDKFKGVDLDQMAKDVDELEMQLEEVPSPVVLSHNDLQYGNIMRTEAGEVVFIDFEYTSYNPRGYDLGNHFCEWAFDYHKTINSHLGDFKRRYPTPEQQREFCRAYLSGGDSDEDGATVSDAEVEALRREANVYSLASHMFWGLWGFIQAAQSNIDFDFLAYGQCRYDAFKARVTVHE